MPDQIAPSNEPADDWLSQIERLIPEASRLALRICGDRQISEDAVQEALIRISRARQQFRGDSQLKTWALRIVIRCCSDALKNHQKNRARFTELCEVRTLMSPIAEGPTQVAEYQELITYIQDAVLTLPDRQREVFVLSVWEKKSPAEIGELLEITLQNVYSTLSVARAHIQSLLKKYQADPEQKS